jgi:hypothetical protein
MTANMIGGCFCDENFVTLFMEASGNIQSEKRTATCEKDFFTNNDLAA